MSVVRPIFVDSYSPRISANLKQTTYGSIERYVFFAADAVLSSTAINARNPAKKIKAEAYPEYLACLKRDCKNRIIPKIDSPNNQKYRNTRPLFE